MTMKCVSCDGDLDHCHGTLIVHLDGLVECTETGCGSLDELRHTLIVECRVVDGGCECTVCGEIELVRVS